jgi:hypothetical protein
VGQFLAQALHSIQSSELLISYFPEPLDWGSPKGHTSPHNPQPVQVDMLINIRGISISMALGLQHESDFI